MGAAYTAHIILRGRLGLSKKIKVFFVHAMRYIGEWRYSSTHSWRSALGRCEWSISRRGRFAFGEVAAYNHRIISLGAPQSRSGRLFSHIILFQTGLPSSVR